MADDHRTGTTVAPSRSDNRYEGGADISSKALVKVVGYEPTHVVGLDQSGEVAHRASLVGRLGRSAGATRLGQDNIDVDNVAGVFPTPVFAVQAVHELHLGTVGEFHPDVSDSGARAGPTRDGRARSRLSQRAQRRVRRRRGGCLH
jgi:hypothetical protein